MGEKKMSFGYALRNLNIRKGVRSMDRELSVAEMKRTMGLDKLKPIQLTPSDAQSMDDDAEYFKGWYEDELQKLFEEDN